MKIVFAITLNGGGGVRLGSEEEAAGVAFQPDGEIFCFRRLAPPQTAKEKAARKTEAIDALLIFTGAVILLL